MFGLKPWRKTAAPLSRFEPPFGWMMEEFPALFNRMFGPLPLMETAYYPWGVMMEEKEKEVVVRFELPGFEAAELKVEVTPERMLVEAEHKVPVEMPEKAEMKEGGYAHVRREFALPMGVEPEKAEAIYRNGVLEVHLPRKMEAIGHRLEVKT